MSDRDKEPDITRILNEELAAKVKDSNTFSSTDQYMIQSLMMAKIYPFKAGYFHDTRSMIVYFEDEPKLQQFVGAIMSGKGDQLTFTYADLWRSTTTWIMLLRYFQSASKSL